MKCLDPTAGVRQAQPAGRTCLVVRVRWAPVAAQSAWPAMSDVFTNHGRASELVAGSWSSGSWVAMPFTKGRSDPGAATVVTNTIC